MPYVLAIPIEIEFISQFLLYRAVYTLSNDLVAAFLGYLTGSGALQERIRARRQLYRDVYTFGP